MLAKLQVAVPQVFLKSRKSSKTTVFVVKDVKI